jgi:hypothetical protein
MAEALEPLKGNLFVATGESGLRTFSRDGSTWTHQQTDREGILLQYVCFANGRCLAGGRYGGDRMIFTTGDGATWTQAKLPGQPYATRLEFFYAIGDRFYAVLHEDAQIPGIISSTDGQTWDARQPMIDDPKLLKHDAHLRRIAYGDGRLVVLADYGARLARKPGEAKFEAVPKPSARDTLIDIAFGNGVFVGGGLHGLRMRSVDGLDWTDRVVGEEGEHINAMIFDGKQFVGIGQGATYFSPDGQTWRREPNENAPTTAAFAKGTYVGSLWPGKLLRSTDAVHWKQVHECPHHVLGLAHGRLGPE